MLDQIRELLRRPGESGIHTAEALEDSSFRVLVQELLDQGQEVQVFLGGVLSLERAELPGSTREVHAALVRAVRGALKFDLNPQEHLAFVSVIREQFGDAPAGFALLEKSGEEVALLLLLVPGVHETFEELEQVDGTNHAQVSALQSFLSNTVQTGRRAFDEPVFLPQDVRDSVHDELLSVEHWLDRRTSTIREP